MITTILRRIFWSCLLLAGCVSSENRTSENEFKTGLDTIELRKKLIFYNSFDQDDSVGAELGNAVTKAVRGCSFKTVHGKFNKALYCNREKKFSSVASDRGGGKLIPGAGTLSMWVCSDWDGTESPAIATLFQIKRFELAYHHKGSQLCFLTRGKNFNRNKHSLKASMKEWQKGRWYQIVITWGNRLKRIYVNGELQVEGRQPFHSSLREIPKAQCIGGTGAKTLAAAKLFNGKIDDVAIWSKPMPPEQVKKLYKTDLKKILKLVIEKNVVKSSILPDYSQTNRPDGVYYDGEPIKINVPWINSGSKVTKGNVVYRLIDIWGKDVARHEKHLTVPGKSRVIDAVSFVPKARGAFRARAELFSDNGKLIAGRDVVTLAVVKDLKRTEPWWDLPTGIHVQPDKFHVELISRLGVGWVRILDHGNDATWWDVFEPEKGTYHWKDQQINLYYDHNLAILANVWTTPYWAVKNAQPGQYKRQSYPKCRSTWNKTPEIQAWVDALKAVATHFKGRILYWELWNEPYAGFLSSTPEHFGEMIKKGAAALRKVDPQNKVSSNLTLMSSSYAHWEEPRLRQDILNHLDFYDIHNYGGVGDPKLAVKRFRELSAPYCNNKKLPIWLSEAGFPMSTFYHDLEGPNIQPLWQRKDVDLKYAQDCTRFIRCFIDGIAAEVDKFFYYWARKYGTELNPRHRSLSDNNALEWTPKTTVGHLFHTCRFIA